MINSISDYPYNTCAKACLKTFGHSKVVMEDLGPDLIFS